MGEAQTTTTTETLTLADLRRVLDSFDLPDDAIVLMETQSYDDPAGTDEVPVARVVASRGYGEPSRIVFGL